MRRRQIFAERQREAEIASAPPPSITHEEPKKRAGWPLGKKRGPRKQK